MINEMEVDGIGIVRLPDAQQQRRIEMMRKGPNKDIAPYAASVGMNIHQYKALTLRQRQAIARAYLQMISSR